MGPGLRCLAGLPGRPWDPLCAWGPEGPEAPDTPEAAEAAGAAEADPVGADGAEAAGADGAKRGVAARGAPCPRTGALPAAGTAGEGAVGEADVPFLPGEASFGLSTACLLPSVCEVCGPCWLSGSNMMRFVPPLLVTVRCIVYHAPPPLGTHAPFCTTTTIGSVRRNSIAFPCVARHNPLVALHRCLAALLAIPQSPVPGCLIRLAAIT
jgi:hypothetical protein